ncbi:unnamed protein product, partial [Prorocentrum cordatum]
DVRLSSLSNSRISSSLVRPSSPMTAQDVKRGRCKVRLSSGEQRQMPIASLMPHGTSAAASCAEPLVSTQRLLLRSAVPHHGGGVPWPPRPPLRPAVVFGEADEVRAVALGAVLPGQGGGARGHGAPAELAARRRRERGSPARRGFLPESSFRNGAFAQEWAPGEDQPPRSSVRGAGGEDVYWAGLVHPGPQGCDAPAGQGVGRDSEGG